MTTVATQLPTVLTAKLDEIRALLGRSNNLVLPVIGSGLSHGLLSWTKLLEQLIAEVPESERAGLSEELAQGRYLEVAGDLEALLHRGRVSAAIARAYKRPSALVPPVYEVVAALPVTHFLTTNFDPWLKDAVARRIGQAPRAHVPHDVGALSDLGPDSPPLVLMLHGDADRPETCVLSERAYRELSHYQAYRQALGALVQQRSLLFVGHSLTDPDLRLVLDEWQEVFGSGGAPRHWFLGVGLSERVRRRLLDRGVMPVEYGKEGDFSLLEPALRYLATSGGVGHISPGVGHISPGVGHISRPVAPALRVALIHAGEPDRDGESGELEELFVYRLTSRPSDPRRELAAFTTEEIANASAENRHWDVDAMRRYNFEIEQYLQSSGRKVLDEHLLWKQLQHCKRIRFAVHSTGVMPAIDVHCRVTFPAGYKLYPSNAGLASRPYGLPTRPALSTDPARSAARDLQSYVAALAANRYPNIEEPALRLFSEPSLCLKGQTVEIDLPKLQQNRHIVLNDERDVIIVVPPAEHHQGEIQVWINSDEQPTPIEHSIKVSTVGI